MGTTIHDPSVSTQEVFAQAEMVEACTTARGIARMWPLASRVGQRFEEA